MTRKTFKSPPKPQPSAEAIDRFIQDGHGRDVETTKAETQKTVQADKRPEETARLTVDMPRSLHRRYKALCSMGGLKMNDDIRQFIEKRVAELEQKTR